MSSLSYFQRRLLDAQLRFGKEGFASYLRVQNFSNTLPSGQPDLFVEVGIAISTTGNVGGYTDILIVPPPSVVEQNMNTTRGADPEEVIWSGRQVFIISHTFVLGQMAQLNLADGEEEKVFRERDGNPAIGIWFDNRLFSINQISREYHGGDIVSWRVLGEAPQQGV